MTHVLIATDGSSQSLTAARYVRALVNPAAIERITVVAVVRPLAAVPFALDFGEDRLTQAGGGELDYSFQEAARAATERVVAEMRGVGGQHDTLVLVGSPADEIVRAARELGADLIVVGSYGVGAVRSVLLGSVSQRILHHAHCPVLVVRPNAAGDAATPGAG